MLDNSGCVLMTEKLKYSKSLKKKGMWTWRRRFDALMKRNVVWISVYVLLILLLLSPLTSFGRGLIETYGNIVYALTVFAITGVVMSLSSQKSVMYGSFITLVSLLGVCILYGLKSVASRTLVVSYAMLIAFPVVLSVFFFLLIGFGLLFGYYFASKRMLVSEYIGFLSGILLGVFILICVILVSGV